jgi:hypothetical protein
VIEPLSVLLKYKFRIIDPAGGITANGDGSIVTQSANCSFRYALLTPQIPATGPPVHVKFRINKFTHPSNWACIGVIGRTNPTSSYYNDSTNYSWAGNGRQVYIAGVNHSGHDGFTDCYQNDIVVLRHDSAAHMLKMHNSRLGRIFTIPGLPAIPFFFGVNFLFDGDQIEVLDVTPDDIALFNQ